MVYRIFVAKIPPPGQDRQSMSSTFLLCHTQTPFLEDRTNYCGNSLLSNMPKIIMRIHQVPYDLSGVEGKWLRHDEHILKPACKGPTPCTATHHIDKDMWNALWRATDDITMLLPQNQVRTTVIHIEYNIWRIQGIANTQVVMLIARFINEV